MPPVDVPAENQPTAEKIALGRKLFFDRRLSFNGTMSCAMCHVPEQGFTNNELATPIGVEGRSLKRNAPTILNVAYSRHLFHDGREVSLETQVVAPLIARDEMAKFARAPRQKLTQEGEEEDKGEDLAGAKGKAGRRK